MSKLQGVCVAKATDLPDTDMIGTTSSYFVCRIGSSGSSWNQKADESKNSEFKSKTVSGTLNPEWNAQLSFNVEKLSQKAAPSKGFEITVKIHEEDCMGTDYYLGEVTIPIPMGGFKNAMDYALTCKLEIWKMSRFYEIYL